MSNGVKKIKIPFAIWMLLTSVIIAFVYGHGFPFRHFVEGEFGFLYIVVVIITGIIFLKVYEASGSLQIIMDSLAISLSRYPLLFLFVSMAFLYLPGMLTGLGVPGVVIAGSLVYPLLIKLNFPKISAVTFITIGAMLGSVTGPVNIPVMIIANGINMPYEGFGVILPAITVPLGIITALLLGLGPILKSDKNALSQGIKQVAEERKNFKVYLPLISLIILFLAPRVFPLQIPDYGTPLIFIVGAIVAFFVRPTPKIGQVLLKAVDSPIFEIVALLLSVGVLVQIAALTGITGSIVTMSVGFSITFIFLAILIALPLVGGVVTMLGSAALFGLPFVLALLGRNTIVVTAGCSVLCALSQLFPPTAIVARLAGEMFDIQYTDILKKSIIPTLITVIFSLLCIIFANEVHSFLT